MIRIENLSPEEEKILEAAMFDSRETGPSCATPWSQSIPYCECGCGGGGC